MKKNILIILFFAFLIIFFGCECFVERVYSIILTNNADHSIEAYNIQMVDKDTKKFPVYPDTLIMESESYRRISSLSYITFDSWSTWEETIKKLPKDTLSIFIFHTDTLNKYSWEEVRDGYKILKRYDLSLEDIKSLNYKIPYPPRPEMSKMKMYPKYP